jgi:uncharacterized protein YqfB (UPF0267 family)
MRVILFQSRFAPMVQSGKKTQTIRKKARCQPGDQLSLRQWSGRPYRSKQEELKAVVCTSVSTVSIGHGSEGTGMSINGEELNFHGRHLLAQLDGFMNAIEMRDWFREVHGLPFEGEIIQWD